jgi:uncharacterized SAM-binding protein YcdF (DUF218 family)
VIFLLGIAFAAWLGKLFVFAAEIPKSLKVSTEETDAIVVLTGGTLRLEQGLALLAQGFAKKLFVSGVHRGVDVQQLLKLSRQSPQALDCCITLGYSADDTTGNASETAKWMREQGYRSLRLVTASYHMPRSLAEFRQAMPTETILPHPVFPTNVKVDNWWQWPGTAALIAGEYNKYLVAVVRHWGEDLMRRPGA